jgi:hypothetical protein
MKFSTEVVTMGGTLLRASVGFDVEEAEQSFEAKGRAFLQVGIRFEFETQAGFRKLDTFVPIGEWPAVEARARAGSSVHVGPERLHLRSEDVLKELHAVAEVAKSVHVEGQPGCLRDGGDQAVRS